MHAFLGVKNLKGSVVALGFLILVGGFFLWMYHVEYTFFGATVYIDYPYREYGFIAGLVGLVIIAIGLAVSDKKPRTLPEAKVCDRCGKRVSEGANVCPHCGWKIHYYTTRLSV
jgi:hypothetical protein